MLKFTVLAACGGAIGAAGRYLVGVGLTRLLGHGFPWGTMAVNIVGSLAMGLLIGIIATRYESSESMRIFLAVGVLGGFTTFSAFSLDVVTLLERKSFAPAALYASASVVLSILALVFGAWLARTGIAR